MFLLVDPANFGISALRYVQICSELPEDLCFHREDTFYSASAQVSLLCLLRREKLRLAQIITKGSEGEAVSPWTWSSSTYPLRNTMLWHTCCSIMLQDIHPLFCGVADQPNIVVLCVLLLVWECSVLEFSYWYANAFP